VKPDAVSDDPLVANYLKWANVVLRVASLLLPYQRPTYRSIEVRTDRGIEERATRFIGDPREEIAQLVIDVMIGEGNFCLI
jgi:hypothetical protein